MDEDEPKGRGRGVVGLTLTALAGGGTAALVSWLDPFGADHADAGSQASAPVEEAGKPAAPAAILTLDPLVVSLAEAPEEIGAPGHARPARRRAPRLRVVVALETDEATAAKTSQDDPRLRDGFIASARALGPDALAGPDGLDVLRQALLESARGILGDDAVTGILLTDYVMT